MVSVRFMASAEYRTARPDGLDRSSNKDLVILNSLAPIAITIVQLEVAVWRGGAVLNLEDVLFAIKIMRTNGEFHLIVARALIAKRAQKCFVCGLGWDFHMDMS